MTQQDWRVKTTLLRYRLAKFNPNHDELGRFSSGPGGGGALPNASTMSVKELRGAGWTKLVSGDYTGKLNREVDAGVKREGVGVGGLGESGARSNMAYRERRGYGPPTELRDANKAFGLGEPRFVGKWAPKGQIKILRNRAAEMDKSADLANRRHRVNVASELKGKAEGARKLSYWLESKHNLLAVEMDNGEFGVVDNPDRVIPLSKLSKFNPNHDKATGQFASGKGSGVATKDRPRRFGTKPRSTSALHLEIQEAIHRDEKFGGTPEWGTRSYSRIAHNISVRTGLKITPKQVRQVAEEMGMTRRQQRAAHRAEMARRDKAYEESRK